MNINSSTIFSGIAGTVFQESPIILTDGIVTQIKGSLGQFGVLAYTGIPLSLFTEPATLVAGGLQSLTGTGVLSQTFANYKPLPGSTLLRYQVAKYPFYTQQIAANASIQEPLEVSMLMYCPATSSTSLSFIKMGIMTLVQSVLNNHIQMGGTFRVITPSYVYQNCLLTGMTDVSTEETKQAQWAWQLDFQQPLLTNPTPRSLNAVYNGIDFGASLPTSVFGL